MYIYRFLKSLDYLSNEYLPNTKSLFHDDVIYYGYYGRDELCEMGVKEELKGEHYLVYSQLDENLGLHYIDIDSCFEYIDLLNQETLSIRKISMASLDASLYEAIWLFDMLASLDDHHFFDAKLDKTADVIDDYFEGNGHDFQSTVEEFDGVPILRDIYIAQFIYFMKKYLKVKLGVEFKKGYPQDHQLFVAKVKEALKRYEQHLPRCFKSEKYTQEKNSEFDEFIQQLDYLEAKQERKMELR